MCRSTHVSYDLSGGKERLEMEPEASLWKIPSNQLWTKDPVFTATSSKRSALLLGGDVKMQRTLLCVCALR